MPTIELTHNKHLTLIVSLLEAKAKEETITMSFLADE